MPSPGSLKELSRVVCLHIATATVPLPDDLTQTIDSYLLKHEKYDDSSSDRLQEELLSIYHQNVKDFPVRHAAFVRILSLLLPVLRTSTRILQWWEILSDSLDGQYSKEKMLVAESFAALLYVLLQDEDVSQHANGDSATNPYADRLLSMWMDKCNVTQVDGVGPVIEKPIREALLFYGKRQPKSFFVALDKFFTSREHRSKSLAMLCDFIHTQPPHVHQVLQTGLFGNLLRCLLIDTSTTIVSLALTALIMLLPHMPSSLASRLPMLFNIYARILFWHRERTAAPEMSAELVDRTPTTNPTGWELCSFSPDVDGLQVPHLRNYFTMLYGLYPINFTDYIRKPQRYLRHANALNADEIEVQPTEIRHQSERFRRIHLLHPNFYTLTIDSEKTDFGRWLKSEPAELVTECMALCSSSETSSENHGDVPAMPGLPSAVGSEESERDGTDPALLSGSVVIESGVDPWRLTQSTAVDSLPSSRVHSTVLRQNSQSSHPSNRDSVDTRSRDVGGDSPTLPAHLAMSPSQSQLQDLIYSNKVIKSGLHQSLTNDSVPSLSLSHQDSASEQPPNPAQPPAPAVCSPLSLTDGNAQTLQLRRQVLLLQNDLRFERFLKQQHMAHIGQLRRRQVKEAASEAETQNLIMANRNLKNRFEDAKKAEMQVRKDSERSRSLAKKWEADLSAKLKAMREEARKSKAQEDSLRKELETAKAECHQLTKLVCDAEVKELNWKQNIQSNEIDGVEIDRLRAEVSRLTISERDFQARQGEMKEAEQSLAASETQAELLRMQLAARETELQRLGKLYESQIVVLKSKLAEAREGRARRQSASANVIMESALAASRAKQAELQKQYSLLTRKYTVLQSSLLDMRCEPRHNQTKMGSPTWSEGETDDVPPTSSPATIKNRPHRVFSDPDTFEAASFNVTSPPIQLERIGSTGTGSMSGHRPSTPTGADSSGPGGLSLSPEQRFHGRGGIQNRIRKEGKEKKKEEVEKKDKKAGGLRGIRGFV